MDTEIVQLNGYDVCLLKQDAYSTKNRFRDSWSLSNMDEILDALEVSGHFVDVGANYGMTFLEQFHKKPTRKFDKYTLIEPIPQCVECIKDTLLLNNIHEDITIHTLGITDIPGKSFFKFEKSKSGTSRIVENKSQSNLIIDCVTLDSLELENIGLLKIDVEGYDMAVLRSAVETIKRSRPLVIFELHYEDATEELFNYFSDLQYAILSPSKYLIKSVEDLRILNISPKFISEHVNDCIAVPLEVLEKSNLECFDIDIDEFQRRARLKLGMDVMNLNKVPYKLINKPNRIYEVSRRQINDTIFVPARSKSECRHYVEVNDFIYFTYSILKV